MTLLLVFLIGVAAGGAAGVLLMALAAVADRASVSFGPRAEGVPAKSSGESPAAPSGAQQGPNETEYATSSSAEKEAER